MSQSKVPAPQGAGFRLTAQEFNAALLTAGVSSAWAAKVLHVSQNTVYRWRNGIEQIPYRVRAELFEALRDLAGDAAIAAVTVQHGRLHVSTAAVEEEIPS